MKKKNAMMVLAACGAAIGLQGAALAQPFVINISGATLLENLVKAPGSTNDFIDVDGNGVAGSLGSPGVQQLAPFGLNPFPANQWWIVQYRVVGSVNGFQELVDFGSTYVTDGENDTILATRAERAFHNRNQYITAGVSSSGIYNAMNPGGAPVRSLTNGTYAATTMTGAGTGIQIDIAPTDVPGLWATFRPGGTPEYTANPNEDGYGLNPRRTVNKQGGSAGADVGHALADLGPRNLFDPTNPGAADSNTIFDTSIAFAPIATLTNFGTGYTQMKMSDLRHMSTTGRMPSGENLIMVTRDSGSGTRNGWMNTIFVDPSWGIGENVGPDSNPSPERVAGPSYVPGQKLGSGALEATLFNTRLGIGYSGAERGVNSGWLTNGQAEVLAIQNDVVGGTLYARPTIANCLFNDSNGYIIGGPAVLSSIGDPRAEPASNGGDDNGLPKMRNVEAAKYLNNLSRSIEAFIALPGGDDTLFMPGEVVATQLTLTNGLDFVNDTLDPQIRVPNPDLNTSLQSFLLSNSDLASSVYNAFGNGVAPNSSNSRAGKVPARLTGQTYTDGVTGSQNFYIAQNSNTYTYGSNLPLRNLVSGDFNGDGLRNINDATEMIRAWRSRNGGPVWVAPNASGALFTLGNSTGQNLANTTTGNGGALAIIEVLGDFDCDGNFNTADIRYWADGLAMVSGALNRCAGFEAIDNAFFAQTGNNNFFGTTLANPSATYDAGDSVADVAGGAGFALGWAPVGHDGVVDAKDIDYVYAQFKQNPRVTDDALNWSNLDEAIGGDLSADINGDLIIDQADIDKILDILETTYGDVNLDGVVDSIDFAIAQGNLGNPGGWADGDMDGDGVITQNDLDIIQPPATCCPGNANGDNAVDFNDVTAVLANWLATGVSPNTNGDANCDGDVNFNDITTILANWLNACP